MNYRKLIAKTFDQRSGNRSQLAFALIAGLAAGAVMIALFATKSGKNVRKQISDKVTGLGQSARDMYTSMTSKMNSEGNDGARSGAGQEQMNHSVHQAGTKKPKSDIKELIHEAHAGGGHTEQSL